MKNYQAQIGRTLILALLLLIGTNPCLAAPIVTCFQNVDTKKSQPDARSADKKEVTAAYRKLSKLIEKSKLQEASQLMTKKAQTQFATETIGAGLLFQTENFDLMDDVPESEIEVLEAAKKTVRRLAKKHKFSIDDIDLEEATEEEFSEFEDKVRTQIKSKLKSGENVWAMVAEFQKALKKIQPSPFGGSIEECTVKGKTARITATPSLTIETDEGEAEMISPPLVHIFKKRKTAWIYDGVDLERSAELAEQFLEEMGEGEGDESDGMDEGLKLDDIKLDGKTVDDQQISLADYKGKVLLIDFWGTWCGPCVAGIPKLKKLHQEYSKQGFEIVGICNDQASKLESFLKKKKLPWKNVIDEEGKICDHHGVQAFPTTILLDRTGKVVGTNLKEKQLRKEIEKLLKQKVK